MPLRRNPESTRFRRQSWQPFHNHPHAGADAHHDEERSVHGDQALATHEEAAEAHPGERALDEPPFLVVPIISSGLAPPRAVLPAKPPPDRDVRPVLPGSRPGAGQRGVPVPEEVEHGVDEELFGPGLVGSGELSLHPLVEVLDRSPNRSGGPLRLLEEGVIPHELGEVIVGEKAPVVYGCR